MKKKRIFKYKFVYWTIVLLNICLFISFLFGIYNRIETNYFDDYLDILSFVFIALIDILSLISLILFIVKNRNSIIAFSGVLLLIVLIVSIFLFHSIFVIKDFGENISDLYTVPIMYLIIFGILFVIHRFKYKENISELEIELIGTHND